MKLNNYNLDDHAIYILNKKIDDQHSEILHLRQRIVELENEKCNFSFNTYPEIVEVNHSSKLLNIIATVGMYKNENTPGHHCIAKFNGENHKQFSYQVSDDIYNQLDDIYLSAMLIELHKNLIHLIINDMIKENKQ